MQERQRGKKDKVVSWKEMLVSDAGDGVDSRGFDRNMMQFVYIP